MDDENYEQNPRVKSNLIKINPIENSLEFESNQFGSKILDQIEDQNKIEEEKLNITDSPILKEENKTKVQITINGEDVFLIKIQKHSTSVTLSDVKNQISRKPKLYGISKS